MDFLPNTLYHNGELLLVRKPHGMASSWGQGESFLDIIKKYSFDEDERMSLWGTKQSIDDVQIRKHQISVFGEEGEYGLLNRLDTVTAWLLYFARSYESKAEYIYLQEQWLITKTYYTQVYGTPREQFGRITTPIYHHRDDASRMTTDPKKWRWKGQEAVTYYEVLSSEILDPRDRTKSQELGTKNHSLLKITITSWCRHQIRCHLASIGHPIVGDRLYMTRWLKKQYVEYDEDKIELVSVGLEIRWNSNF